MLPAIPDRLPHEPVRQRPGTVPFVALVLVLGGVCVATASLSTTVLLPFLLGWALWGYPPHLAQLPHILRHGRQCFTEPNTDGKLPPLNRVWLALRITLRLVEVPLWGCAWYLDELLYGRRLDQHTPERPLFLLSAARSGSTQLAHYLESDPGLVAPVMLQIVFPYIWLWKLVVPTLGRLVSGDWLEKKFNEAVPLEMKQRHEGHPLRTDTFEVLWMLNTTHIIAARISPRTLADDAVFMGTADHNRTHWDTTLVRFVDRIGRKTLLYANAKATGQRLFIKGHFLESRDAMAAQFPDAHFLTVVRDPVKRIESAINHLHANAIEEPLGATPWSWIVPALVEAESRYCTTEMAWYDADPTHRTVVHFTDYVADLPGTMEKVFVGALGRDAVPPHVPRTHAPRQRTNYVVHRTLEDLEVDRAALAERLHDYRVWCGAVPADPT